MANPDLEIGALQKPARGSALLEREKKQTDAVKNEREVIAEAKKRDVRCRWPEAHKCRGGYLEGAHIIDKSRCGETTLDNIVTLCPWLHRRGPESIHGKQLKIEKETAAGANGPLSFWRQTGEFDALGQAVYYLVARERAPGIVERD